MITEEILDLVKTSVLLVNEKIGRQGNRGKVVSVLKLGMHSNTLLERGSAKHNNVRSNKIKRNPT
jgi:hypothetical protein